MLLALLVSTSHTHQSFLDSEYYQLHALIVAYHFT